MKRGITGEERDERGEKKRRRRTVRFHHQVAVMHVLEKTVSRGALFQHS
jgi:hypothetical protein